jgi:mannosyl-oligosaccharide alpha-1,2-mannosidase
LKAWIQSSRLDIDARDMFEEAMISIINNMVRISPGKLTYVSKLNANGVLEDTMEHLACFAGGMFGMAARSLNNNNSDLFMHMGEEITKTCYESYFRSPSKLGPEKFQ